ncbi:hypothetical protein VIN01S_15850 [Vibrio inusitatus NBRC 102082]|uniref:MFS transporter n=1 Tax=Vibrio inusitatus NBRC 102082 TaxID=1219070 RepID=A0A4Y3HUX3_9VIBR|nr:MFS transporter [Vibrio inusitatus]GEA50781.1 hypothetical protein VIN01S_15850 [Vibrio inusitatus NBRC 102082]
MSLVSLPFVGSNADTALHVVAAVVLVGTLVAVCVAFWKLHELPIHKAHSSGHHQIGLITVLTWIGFIWHWVWVLAIIAAFLDLETAIVRVRDIWRHGSLDKANDLSTDKGESSC